MRYQKCRKETEANIFDGVYTKRNVHNISELWGFVAVVAVLLVCLATRYNLHNALPKALGNTDLLHNPNSFIADRAWKDLKILTSWGPRSTGSYGNEVLAIDFLKREIGYIKQAAHKNQRIELDVQVVSGGFWNGQMTSVYRNVQNVVVKLHGTARLDANNNEHRQTNDTSLLLNCHYDTVPGSPGASDDAANCVVMLEILRVLSRMSDVNTNSIIFLFNGAEELGLQASHGFVTQHKWASEIKAFINLESMGSAGKELLFQSSPNNSWLVQLYGRAAPYPSAQVAAEEIFQSGLIPSDTDFRIFQGYGGIPGLDFAHILNGYRYHTKYDHIDYITKSVLQHTGENILELTKLIANFQDLSIAATHKAHGGPQVYFDILGYLFVSYSVDFATIFNYIVVTCAVYIPYLFLSTKGINKKHVRYEIFLGFLINMISLVASNAVCYAIAYDLDLSGKSMTWYSNTFMCVPTYCLVTVFIQCAVHLLLNQNTKAPISLALQTQSRLIGTSFFWAILAAALTGAGIRTAYAIVIPLLITLISNICNGISGYQNRIRGWLYIHLIGQTAVLLWTSNFYNMVVDVFIPIAGRSGGGKNPDIMIAIICSTLTFYMTSYLTPLVILFRKWKNLFVILFATYIITRFYFIAFTNYGFPYSDASHGNPRVQRHFMTHASRTLYDKENKIRYTDAGWWMLELDRNSRKTIESLTMPYEMKTQDENILCRNEVFCGLPIFSIRQLKSGGFWIPGPAPIIRETCHLSLVSHERPTDTLHRLNFMLTGNYLVALQIRLKDAVSLEKWTLMATVPPMTEYNKQKAYFVMISHGLEAAPLNITLELKTLERDYKRSMVDIALITHYFDYKDHHTTVFANMLAKLPAWSTATASVASLKSWTF